MSHPTQAANEQILHQGLYLPGRVSASLGLDWSFGGAGPVEAEVRLAVLTVLLSIFLGAWAPGASVGKGAGRGAASGGVPSREGGEMALRGECAPRRGGWSSLPGAPLAPVLPDTVSVGHHGAVTFRGLPAAQAGFRVGVFCSPCTASEQEPVMPGVRGPLCVRATRGRSESTARAAGQEPAAERSPVILPQRRGVRRLNPRFQSL